MNNNLLPGSDTDSDHKVTKPPMDEDRAMVTLSATLIFLVAVGFAVLVLVSCGGSMTSPPSGTAMSGQVTTIVTDPPTCGVPNGPFTHVWVTITKVTAHINANASDTDSDWQTLVDLSSNPKQIDLFSLASPACVLPSSGRRRACRLVITSKSESTC